MTLYGFRWFDKNLAGSAVFMLKADVDELKGQGITAVVSLQDLAETGEACLEGGLKRIVLPLAGGELPSEETRNAFFKFVREEAEAGGKTVVHCAGGTWRTALMGAYWLIENGSTAEEAVERVRYVLQRYQLDGLRGFALKKAGERAGLEEGLKKVAPAGDRAGKQGLRLKNTE